MIIITSISADAFELNGVRYPSIYQPIVGTVAGVDTLGIYNVYDSRQTLLSQTPFDEIELDGTVYASRDLLIDALLPVIYKSVGTAASVNWGGITGILSNQTDLQAALDGKAGTSHTHTTSDISNLSVYTGFDVRYYTKAQSDANYAPLSHTHTAIQITDLSSYTGFANYYTKTSTDTLLGGKSDIAGTPVNNQIAVWTDGNTIEGDSLLLWDGSTLSADGDISSTGLMQAGSLYLIPTDVEPSPVEGAIYFDDSENAPKYYDGTAWVAFGSGGGGGGTWGSITGTLSDQTDLQSALDGKASSSHTHTTSDITNLSSYTGFDARYYTETEVDSLLNGKVDTTGDTMTGDLTITGVTQSNLTVSDGFIGASNGHAYKALMGTSSTTNNYLFGGSSTGSANTFDTYLRVRSVADGDLTFQEASNAWKVWHEGNIDPVDKTGDTMTGRLTVTGNGVPLLTEGTGAIGDLSAQNYYVARDSAGVNLWYLGMPSASNNDLTLYNYDSARALTIKDGAGELTYNGSTVDFTSAALEVNDIKIDDISIWYVSSADTAHQRADARDDATNFARLHWYGVSDAGSTSNFRHAWYDGSAYIDVTATSGGITWDSASSGVASYVVTGGVSGTSLTVGTAGSSEGELNIVKGDAGSMGISYEDNYFRYRRGGGGTIAGWRWDNFDNTIATLATDGALTTNGYRMGASAGYYQSHPTSSRDKFRVWNSALYTIGFQASMQFGALNTDYAMTFQVNSDNDRGWWWGDDVHTSSQGAMALTSNGKLTVATGIRVGYGESDTTVMGTTYDIQVNGDVQANDYALASDERLKDNIEKIGTSLSGWNWYKYNYKHKDRVRYGSIAQRVEETHPEVVIVDEEGMRGLSYTDMLVIEDAKKTQKILELEDKIERLEFLVEQMLGDRQ